jgi:hypothetical protein
VAAGAVFGLVPAWVVLRGWVGTRWEEGQTAQRWLASAQERYTQTP